MSGKVQGQLRDGAFYIFMKIATDLAPLTLAEQLISSHKIAVIPGDTFGMALNLERDSVGAVVLGPYEHISEGDIVKCTGRILEVPVGDALIGRVVNPLGEPQDGKGPIVTDESRPVEHQAVGVAGRQPVA